MSEVFVNGFTGGLDKDTDKSLIQNSSYLHADNFRLVTDKGSTTGSLTNIKGTENFLSSIPVGHVILGHAQIRDDLYLFTLGDADACQIRRLTIDKTTDIPSVSNNKLICERLDLGFSVDHPIKAIGRYENENIQKLYWTDGVNPLRSLNVADELPGGITNDATYIQNISLELFNMTPNSNLNTIQLTDVVNGTLKSGVIQYAYQLFVRNGAETTFSPLSPVYHLSESAQNSLTNVKYQGSPQFDDNGDRVNTGKGLEIKISNIDSSFNRIRVVSVHYASLYDTPEINIIHEGSFNIESGDSNLTIVDTGAMSLGNYTIEELSMIGELSFSANTLETKDNRLFIGNVVEEYEEVTDDDFDARAYRFSSATDNINFSNYVTIDGDDIIFSKTIVFRGTAKTGLTTDAGNWDKFWYLENDIIYLLAPLDVNATVDSTAYTTSSVDDIYEINNIYSYDGTNISFGGRDIHSTIDIRETEDLLDFPVGWVEGGGTASEARIDGSNTITIPATSPDWSVVPNNHDAINPSNDLSYTGTRYIYKTDGVTLGGEGDNISYEFEIKQTPIDQFAGDDILGSSYPYYKVIENQDTYYIGTDQFIAKGYADYSSPFRSATLRGYARDEVYRFAIVFFDKKMRPLPAKWISDIRMPSLSDVDNKVTYTIDDGVTNKNDFSITTPAETILLNKTIKANILYLKFNVDIPEAIKSKISGYQIVRCPRMSEDRTVIAQGVLSFPFEKIAGEYYSYPTPFKISEIDAGVIATNTIAKDIGIFDSPEVSFNKNISLQGNDFIRIESVYEDASEKTTPADNNDGMVSGYKLYSKLNGTRADLFDNKIDIDITDSNLLGVRADDDPSITVNSKAYYHYAKSTTDVASHKGTSLILELNSAISIPAGVLSGEPDGYVLATYRRQATPYGGNTYVVRSYSKYIAACPFVPFDNIQNVYVYGGDAFISMFENLYVSRDETVTDSHFKRSHFVVFPVETSINLNLRNDTTVNKEGWDSKQIAYLQESKNVGLGYADLFEDRKYPDRFTDLYLYNSVYSRDNDAKIFFAETPDRQTLSHFDTRVYNSDLKRNGESIDSWLKFMPNSFIDLSSEYGSLTKLVNYKDRLIFLQEKGFGILSVNYQSVLQDVDSRNIVLGTGGLLDRADYISTTSGTRHDTSVITTPTNLLWFDALNKKAYRLGKFDEPLSDVKGMNSYFQHNISGSIVTDNKYTSGGSYVIGAYDDKFMEIVYTFYMYENPSDSFTLSYNLKLDNFISFYSFIPKIYIEYNKSLLSSEALNNLWIHNYGDYGTFYGNAPEDSTLKIIINDNYWNTKVFDVIQYNSESTSDEVNIYNDTFDEIRCYNDYQNTDFISLTYGDNIERRERTWSLHVPRNVVDKIITTNPDIFASANLDNTQLFKARMRDKYMIVDLKYENNNNYKFTIPGILTKYRISAR